MEPVMIKFTLPREERTRLKVRAIESGFPTSAAFLRSLVRSAIGNDQKPTQDREAAKVVS